MPPQVVILAGGLGTRLRPVTADVPKPMVPVAGSPYLEHQLKLLRRQGVTDVILLVGYLSEQIEAYFGGGERLGLNICYSRESTPLGTGGALLQAQDLLADAFVLIYGDSFLPIRYTAPLETLLSSSAEGVVVVYEDREGETGVIANIALDDGGLVSRYEKDLPDRTGLRFIDAGVMAFRKQVLSRISAARAVSLEKEVFPILIDRCLLRGHITRQRFYDIGTPQRLQTIEHFFSHDYHTHAVSN